MAVPANTFQTYTDVGVYEDLEDMIYRIAPTERPFYRNIRTGKATQTNHEWQTQDLRAAVTTNAHVQGDDTAATAPKTTTRLGNYTQIFKESGSVSGTVNAVDAAGRDRELAYQELLKGQELLNDVEATLLSGNIATAGNSTTAPTLAGVLSWMTSNVSRGAGGANAVFTGGRPTTGAVNGTQRPLTEALLKSVLQSAFTNGAKGPRSAYMSAFQKGVFSSFAGIAQIRRDVSGENQATIVGAADVYISDFGPVYTVPVQFGLTRDVLVANNEFWEKTSLRPMRREMLAKTGDSDKFQIITELTLTARNQKSSALIADLTTS